MKVLSVVAATATVVSGMTVHSERAQFIDELNSMPDMTWTAAPHARFSHMPVGKAMQSLLGVKVDSHALTLEKALSGEVVRVSRKADHIPESFDSATAFPECGKLISTIRDQSNCGCCWAFGGAEAASDRMCIATKGELNFPLSAQDVCFCSSWNGCGGGQLYTAWSYIKNTGAVTGGLYNQTGPYKAYCSAFSLPHCHHHGPQRNDPYPAENDPGCPSVRFSPSCPSHCDNAAASPHDHFSNDKYGFQGQIENYENEESIQTALMEGGPVETAFDVYSDFENYASGIYDHRGGNYMGGHAVKIVGWGVDNGVKYWKIANSWNPYWGEDGYFRIKRGSNECGIESQAMASAADSKWGKF